MNKVIRAFCILISKGYSMLYVTNLTEYTKSYRGYILAFFSILWLTGCNKEIVFKDEFDESLFYLNGVIGVGETSQFTMGAVTSAADTFDLDFSCDGVISLISNESIKIDPVKWDDGRCKYLNSSLKIAPKATYTVKAKIDDQMLTSEIETPPLSPYEIKVMSTKYLGPRVSGTSYKDGVYTIDSTFEYRIRILATFSGDELSDHHVGFTIQVGSDSGYYASSNILDRTSMRPRAYRAIDELVTDTEQNNIFEVITKIGAPEQLDSITIVPMVWTVDEPFYKYMLSYDEHSSSISDPFSVPARMYNNIDGGVGIFGSYSRSMDTIRIKLPE